MSDHAYRSTHREYVGAIFEMEGEGVDVIQARIAEWLGVSRASVSEMVRKLASEGLIAPEPPIRLTEVGRRLAAVTVLLRLLTLHHEDSYMQLSHAAKRAGAITDAGIAGPDRAGLSGWRAPGTGHDEPHLQDWCCHHHSVGAVHAVGLAR